jgi:stage V sporulation protein D (sporulation-specific penicillin-binding protein)
MPGKYIASFAGFTPADDPQIVMLVIIDEPVGLYYGGLIAAPVFAGAMQDILQYMKVMPRITKDADKETQESHIVVPSVINLLVPEAIEELNKSGLQSRIEEAGGRVVDQIPKPGSRVPKDSSVLLYTMTPRYGTGEVTVPDCSGKSLREVADMLAEVGLSINPVGVGLKSINQQPPAGDKVLPGTGVTVSFE